MNRVFVTATALSAVLAACGDTTGSETGRVVLRFGTVSPDALSSVESGAVLSLGVADDVSIVGTNGTLKIDDIQFIVSEVELKRADDALCDDDEGDGRDGDREGRDEDDDECEEFEGGPFLVDLPLGGATVTVLEKEIPAGTFTAIEFEIEDFEMEDDDDDSEQRRANQLLTQLRATYRNLPEGANMVVRGVFTPTTGAARPFTVYLNADVEIKERFAEPVIVQQDGGITVRVDPSKWFKIGNQVRDLSQLDGRLVEFEFEMKNGFVKVERDD